MAAKNPPSAEYKKEVFKYIPIMRQYGLDAAADHLQDWVTGQVALAPLLDVTACLDCTSTIGFPMVASPFFAVFSHRQFDPVFRWDDFFPYCVSNVSMELEVCFENPSPWWGCASAAAES